MVGLGILKRFWNITRNEVRYEWQYKYHRRFIDRIGYSIRTIVNDFRRIAIYGFVLWWKLLPRTDEEAKAFSEFPYNIFYCASRLAEEQGPMRNRRLRHLCKKLADPNLHWDHVINHRREVSPLVVLKPSLAGKVERRVSVVTRHGVYFQHTSTSEQIFRTYMQALTKELQQYV